MGGLDTPLLVVVFVGAGAATWAAGIFLSKSTDALDVRLGLGEELGGLILLAITGSLPEIAITASAALSGHLDLAVGNLIGGVAIQTLVLVALDAAAGPHTDGIRGAKGVAHRGHKRLEGRIRIAKSTEPDARRS